MNLCSTKAARTAPQVFWGWSREISGGFGKVPGSIWEVLEGSLGVAWGFLGVPRAALEVSLGTLGRAWGAPGGPWRVLGGSLGVPRGPWGSLGLLGLPNGTLGSSGPAPDQFRVYHAGVWPSPKLLAKAKSNENERKQAESTGSNTPWAYRPGDFPGYLFANKAICQRTQSTT